MVGLGFYFIALFAVLFWDVSSAIQGSGSDHSSKRKNQRREKL
jgi:hypothetical protein